MGSGWTFPPASQAGNTVACDLLSAQADVMIRPAPGTPAYLYADPVDMRKSINGLAALVEQEMALSPFEAVLFVFCNRQRDKIKFLGWERNDFVLWYKRLEKHRFKWPADSQPATLDGALLNHCWMATRVTAPLPGRMESRFKALHSASIKAHVRRKFNEAIKAQGKPTKGKPAKAGKAQVELSYIRKLYRIERDIADQPPDRKYAVRQQQSLQVLAELRGWLDRSLPQVPPKTALGKALQYLHNQWSKLVSYCEAGYLRMDNNRAENAIRPFVIGRKNGLFSNGQAGARASANLYSLVETAKANGLEPWQYLNDVLSKLAAADRVEDIEALLPWNSPAKQ